MRQTDTMVARLPAEVDYDNASDVAAQCTDLANQDCSTLVLDASEVKYLDSSGISMIITLSRVLDDRAGTLRLAALSDHYQQVWRILGLDTLLPVFPTVNAALNGSTTVDLSGTGVGGSPEDGACW
ncbi:STAS domain-containing protein [Streptomyces sp. NPDC051133]|uniref:STAS domain-containing protein n=1 Tax=Streptomyces sp. NPDC051133 TaxID=3155521 RepID=UPI00341FDBC4